MSTKLSMTEVKKQLSRFSEIAPDKKFELGEIKGNGRYIHILRNGKIIGCFVNCPKEGVIKFELHNSYPGIRVPINDLTDRNIKDAIDKTPGG